MRVAVLLAMLGVGRAVGQQANICSFLYAYVCSPPSYKFVDLHTTVSVDNARQICSFIYIGNCSLTYIKIVVSHTTKIVAIFRLQLMM